jgi:glycerol-1-phosphate dehydrogenase [NAD(P)+]
MINKSSAHALIQYADRLVNVRAGVCASALINFDVVIGEGLVNQQMNDLEDYRLLIEDHNLRLIREHNLVAIKNIEKENPDSNTIISIGSFHVHNQAKQKPKRIITIPIPLANDSFCTDRCNQKPGRSSTPCRFPDKILIDLELLCLIDRKANLLGLGELISTYYSILDYCFSRDLDVPIELLDYLSAYVKKTWLLLQNDDYQGFLRYLSAGLIMKCGLMKSNGDHEIGCGGDHMIGKFIERNYMLPHGQAVFYGAMILSLLNPQWRAFGLSAGCLQEIGKGASLFDPVIFQEIIHEPDLIQKSIATRPNRPSVLKNAQPLI